MRLLFVFVILMIFTTLFAQDSKIVTDKFYSASLEREINVNIYQPANFSLTGEPYRVYIYLHGCCGSVNWDYASFLKPILDKLINNNQIDPILAVFPVVKFQTVHGKAISNDFHFFSDSERNGKYASVISVDLLEWLADKYNASTLREHRGIAGFSMGAEASVRIAIRNSDKFIACISHDGVPSIQANRIDLPPLLAETPGPPYDFKISNGFFSALWFGLSAALSPNMTNPNKPEWFIDFPIDDQGNVIDSVFTEKWMTNHDPVTMIQNPDIYKNEIGIYFDATSYGKPYSDIFHTELSDIGFPHAYKIISGGHGIYEETEEAALLFLDAKMDAAIAKVEKERNQIIKSFQLFASYPNPFNSQTTIPYRLERAGEIRLEIYNCLGKKIKTLIDEWKPADNYEIKWNGRDDNGDEIASGLYIYNLVLDDFSQTNKMLMLK